MQTQKTHPLANGCIDAKETADVAQYAHMVGAK